MLGLNLSSFSEIKKEIDKYLTERKDIYNVIDSQPGSVRTMIVDLLSGFLTYLNYKYLKYRDESYLSTAKQKESVYNLARHFGYRVNRNKAPILQVQYNGPTSNIVSGTKIGEYLYNSVSLDLVYFGESRKIVTGTMLDIVIGNYKKIETDLLSYDFTKTVLLQIPTSTSSVTVDNNLVKLYLNSTKHNITHIIENFIVGNKVTDITRLDDGAELWVYDANFDYGTPVTKETSVKIEYIETKGAMPNILQEISDGAFTFGSEYTFVKVISYGLNGDSLEMIKNLAPLYYTTFRRMVTEDDHLIITRAYPGILDTRVWRDNCHCCQTNVCYLKEGSSNVPSVFTPEEEAEFHNYLNDFRLVGNKIEIQPAIPKSIKLWFFVSYDCSLAGTSQEAVDMDNYLYSEVSAIVKKQELKLNHTFNISELIVQMGNVLYKGQKPIKRVYVKTLNELGELIDVTEEDVFSCDMCEYFYIESTFELGCY